MTAIVLAMILFAYWWLLVRREPQAAKMGGGGPPAMHMPTPAVGREDVIVEPFAGESPGFRDGPAWQAQFSGPNALALGPDDTVYVADSRNHRIRRITRASVVSTVAGAAEPGGPGGMSDGPASAALFRYPSGVAVAPDGTIYVADTGNHRICRVREGMVSTLAGGTEGRVDGQGSAARFAFPGALSLDAGGSLWVADYGNGVARRVDVTGRVTTPASVPPEIAAALGDISMPKTHPRIWSSPGGHGAPEETQYSLGRRSAAAGRGSVLLFADLLNAVLMEQRPGQPPLLIAGVRLGDLPMRGAEDTNGAHVTFGYPAAVVLGGAGIAYVADAEANRIRRLRLPAWLPAGEDPPARAMRDFGREIGGR